MRQLTDLPVELHARVLDRRPHPVPHVAEHYAEVAVHRLQGIGSSLGGSVVLDGATVTYTPPAGATNVTDRFVYVVTDGRGGVSAEVISIRIGG